MINCRQIYLILIGVFLTIVGRNVYSEDVTKTTPHESAGNTNSWKLTKKVELLETSVLNRDLSGFKRTMGRYEGVGSTNVDVTQRHSREVIYEGHIKGALSQYEGHPSDEPTNMSEEERDEADMNGKDVISDERTLSEKVEEIGVMSLQNEDLSMEEEEEDEREENIQVEELNKKEKERKNNIVPEFRIGNEIDEETKTEDGKANYENSKSINKEINTEDSTATEEERITIKEEPKNENSTEATDTETENPPEYEYIDRPTRNDLKEKNSKEKHGHILTESSSNTPNYAKLGQFPWIVVFRASALHKFKNGDPLCTGSLVDAKWVLTVAHCFQPNDNPSLYTVFAGIIELPAAEAAHQEITKFYQERKVSEIIPHISFKYEELEKFQTLDIVNGVVDLEKNIYPYDIALMRLQLPFSDDSQVIIRPLDLKSPVVHTAEALLCTIVSWERFQDESQRVKTQVELRLQWKNVSVEPPEVCENQYKVNIPKIVCVGSTSNSVNKTCFGPGGSPLVCTSTVTNRVSELIGLSLWYKTSVGCTYILPQYLSIKDHEQWLQQVMYNPDQLPVKPMKRAAMYINTTSRLCVNRALALAVIVCSLSRISWAQILGLERCFYHCDRCMVVTGLGQ